jgi:hypothetical protein
MAEDHIGEDRDSQERVSASCRNLRLICELGIMSFMHGHSHWNKRFVLQTAADLHQDPLHQ